jgi:hypothetical protein
MMEIAHPKTNIRRTFLELCFDFMVDIVAIELRLRQQVAAEALQYFQTRIFPAKVATKAGGGSFTVTKIKYQSAGRAARIVT